MMEEEDLEDLVQEVVGAHRIRIEIDRFRVWFLTRESFQRLALRVVTSLESEIGGEPPPSN